MRRATGWRFWMMAAAAVVMGAAARGQTTVDLPVLNAYVWRGQVLNNETVVQPALNVSSHGFGVNVWGNYNTTDRSTANADFSEIDLTLSYGREFGPLSLSGGLIEYLFPNTDYAATREVYLSAELTGFVTPSLSVYRDLVEADGSYAVLSVSKDLTLDDSKTLSLRVSLGGADRAYNKFYFGVEEDALNDATAGATLAWELSDTVTLEPGFQYSWLVDPGIRDGARALYQESDEAVGSLMLTITL